VKKETVKSENGKRNLTAMKTLDDGAKNANTPWGGAEQNE